MTTLQYWDGTKWLNTGTWNNERMAWASLGGDDYGYRTIDEDGNVLTDKSGS